MQRVKRQLILASLATVSSISHTTTALSPRLFNLPSTVARQHKFQSTFASLSSSRKYNILPERKASVFTTIHSLRNINKFQLATTSTMTATETSNNGGVLQKISPSEVTLEIKDPVNPKALEQAKAILNDLVIGNTDNGRVNADKLLEVAKRLGDVDSSCTVEDLVVSKDACKEAYEALNPSEKKALDNMHLRIKSFAEMQRASVKDTEMDIPGGKAGHTVSPCRGT